METSQLMKMFEIVKSSSNPKSVLQMMANSNPELKQIMTELSSNNTSPKDLFYSKAKEKGMSDQDIDKLLTTLKALM